MNKKNNNCTPKDARIAWFDRNIGQYFYGSWKPLDSSIEKMHTWVCKQNKKYPRIKYWIELKDPDGGIPKNIESYEIIPVTISTDKDNIYTEWLSI